MRRSSRPSTSRSRRWSPTERSPRSTRNTASIIGGREPPARAASVRLLPPEAERLLRCAIRVAEEHALGVGAEAVGLPRRHDEHIVRREIEARFADRDAAAPFQDAEDRALGAAIVAARESA